MKQFKNFLKLVLATAVISGNAFGMKSRLSKVSKYHGMDWKEVNDILVDSGFSNKSSHLCSMDENEKRIVDRHISSRDGLSDFVGDYGDVNLRSYDSDDDGDYQDNNDVLPGDHDFESDDDEQINPVVGFQNYDHQNQQNNQVTSSQSTSLKSIGLKVLGLVGSSIAGKMLARPIMNMICYGLLNGGDSCGSTVVWIMKNGHLVAPAVYAAALAVYKATEK